MEDFVLILLVFGLVMFILGIAMVIATVRFVLRKEHSLLTILFAILQCPCIYIPIQFTIGFNVAKVVLIATFIYGIGVLVVLLKNKKV